MRRTLALTLTLLLPLFAACTTETVPPTDAELLTTVEGLRTSYDTWDQAPGAEGVLATPGGMHGEYVQAWYNPEALADLAVPEDRATSFKDGYVDADGTQIMATTVMRYADGYGWFYAMWDDSGALQASGAVTMCAGCHEAGDQAFLIPNR